MESKRKKTETKSTEIVLNIRTDWEAIKEILFQLGLKLKGMMNYWKHLVSKKGFSPKKAFEQVSRSVYSGEFPIIITMS
ncbi:MAG: hypothetical protein LBD88_02410 [Candidatus Peribacteria bacterium]|nr:hypothetical protein [Candidatus Peribacteria bacterium]